MQWTNGYAAYVVMFMIRQKAILKTTSRLEQNLKISRTPGNVQSAVQARMNSAKKSKNALPAGILMSGGQVDIYP